MNVMICSYIEAEERKLKIYTETMMIHWQYLHWHSNRSSLNK